MIMDPRMMSGRPAMDIPPIHPGELESALLHGSLTMMEGESFSVSPHFSLNSFESYKDL